MSSAALVPFVVTAPNVVHLSDTDIDVIVDLRIFGHDAWCPGCYECMDGKEYRCPLCGSRDNWGLAARIFGDPHPRMIPWYTADYLSAWLIVKAIQQRGKETRLTFMRYLEAMLSGQGCTFAALSAITPRMIAIAALQAIGAVDTAGYIIKREGVQ
jgi:hypothetical protein